MSTNKLLQMHALLKKYKIYSDFEKINKLRADLFIANNAIQKTIIRDELHNTLNTLTTFFLKNSEGMSRTSILYWKPLIDAQKESAIIQYEVDLLKFEEVELKESEVKIRIKEANKVKRIITDIYKDNINLLKIQPREFEEVIAEILLSQGFEIELTKQTRDNGYDILALKDTKSEFPLKFLVECKRFTTQKVGIEIIRSFKDVILTEKANKGIIVTTSYFSSEAHKRKKETPYLLDYRDKDDVIRWINKYYQEKICS